jgi:FlaA1/EpsC-like NDP-sugar epimerase
MEANIFEAVENNILGTFNVANAAQRLQCCDFVMISSDKAVRPSSVMGLTKRVAELIVRSMPDGPSNFVSVRFGNVLGSNGSVVPIFREQIAAGGPIKITHPDMRRYFMTIPEASQLVLQASTMGKGREIFVLEMGEQIKIVDLARSLILLSGLRPEQDIGFEFTGIRPGEKLFEELNDDAEQIRPTYHEKIKIFAGADYIDELPNWIEHVRHLCATRNLHLIVALKEIVADYSPSSDILQMLIDEHKRPIRPTIVESPAHTLTMLGAMN